MRQTRPPLPSAADLPLEPMSIEQIDAQFKGHWVLIKVTARNELHITVEGQVVAYGTSKQKKERLAEIAAKGLEPGATYYLTTAGAFIRQGTEKTSRRSSGAGRPRRWSPRWPPRSAHRPTLANSRTPYVTSATSARCWSGITRRLTST